MGLKKQLIKNLPSILFYLTMAMFLLPMVPRGVRPVLLSIYGVFSITSGILYKQKFNWQNFLINSGLLISYLISLFYSENLDYGLRKLTTCLPLILFPLFFSSMATKCLDYILERRYQLMWCFIVATLAFCIMAFFIFYDHYTFEDVLIHYVNIIRSDISGFKIHPIYLSMHICVSIIFSLFLINRGLDLKHIILLAIINVLLVGFLLILIKKGPIIALLLVMGYLVFMFKNRLLYLIFGFAIIGLIGLVILSPKVNERFSELLEVRNADASMTNSTNIRYTIYQCAGSIISEAGIFGYGVGDGKRKLVQCYESEAQFLVANNYNSHNQYLGIILKSGYLGLFLFVIFVLYQLIKGLNNRNHLLVALLLFYCMVMFSENILERENGVMFFALLINLFVMLNYPDRMEKVLDKIPNTAVNK